MQIKIQDSQKTIESMLLMLPSNYSLGNVFTITSGQHFITNTDSTVMHITGVVSVTGGTNYISGNLLTDLRITGSTNYFTGLVTDSVIGITGGINTLYGVSGLSVLGGTNTLYAQNVEGNVSITGSGTQVISGINFITGTEISITGGTSDITGININIYSGMNTLIAEDGTLRIYSGESWITLDDLGVVFVRGGVTHITGGTNEIETETVLVSGGTNYISGSGLDQVWQFIDGETTLSVSGDVTISGGATTINDLDGDLIKKIISIHI